MYAVKNRDIPGRETSAAGRDYFWDNLRCFLIILVIWCHGVETARGYSELLRTVHETVLSFLMPTFVFVTGYFAKGMAKEGEKRLKICNLLLLYTLFQLAHMIVRNGKSFLKPAYGGWYLMGIMVWYLVLPIVSRFKPWAAIGVSVLAAALCGMDPAVTKALQLSRLICFFPFFLLGYYCTGETGNKLKEKHVRIAEGAALAAMIVFCLVWWTKMAPLGILHAHKTFAEMKIVLGKGVLLRIAWYIVATMMGFGFLALVPRKRVPLLSTLGTRTLPIFVWHVQLYSIIACKTDLFPMIGERFGAAAMLIYFLAAIVFALLFGSKWAAKPLDILMKYRFTPFLNKSK